MMVAAAFDTGIRFVAVSLRVPILLAAGALWYGHVGARGFEYYDFVLNSGIEEEFLILSSLLRPRLPSAVFPSDLLTKTQHTPLLSTVRDTCHTQICKNVKNTCISELPCFCALAKYWS